MYPEPIKDAIFFHSVLQRALEAAGRGARESGISQG